jgi:hypothetical protein
MTFWNKKKGRKMTKEERIEKLAELLADLPYGVFTDLFQRLGHQYHVTKKGLTEDEIRKTLEDWDIPYSCR